MPPSKTRRKKSSPSRKSRGSKGPSPKLSSPYSLGQMSEVPDLQMSPLGVEVPEIESAAVAEEVDLDYDYQWQNPVLLETIYDREETEGNERLNALRQFLFLIRELELEGSMPETGTPLSQEDIDRLLEKDREEISKEKKTLSDRVSIANARLGVIKGALPAKEKEKKAAKAARKAALKEKRPRELRKIKVKSEEAIAKLKEGALKKAEGNLNWVERVNKNKRYTPEEYESKKAMWQTRKQNALDKIQAEQTKIDTILPEYNLLVEPYYREEERLQAEIDALKAERKDLQAKNKDDNNRLNQLEKELGSIEKVAKGKSSALQKWKKDRYARQLHHMDHQQLMDAIQDLFATDPKGERFPQWLRYAVLQYSGTRYASSHNNFYSPQRMLSILKDKELEEASHWKRQAMAAEGLELLHSDTSLSGIGGKKATSLVKNYQKQLASDPKKRLPPEDLKAWEQIQVLEDLNLAHYAALQKEIAASEKTLELERKIEQNEKDIASLEAGLSEKARKKVSQARAKRKQVLVDIYMAQTKAKIEELSDLQALKYLEMMHEAGQIPEAVWEEIETFTQLRLNADSTDWEVPKSRKGLKDVKGKTPEEDKQLDAWREILTKNTIYHDSTGWRSHHAETLSPLIVTQMVCDQLGSMLQHVRGHSRKGGLRNNALYYENMATQSGSGAFFKNPTSVGDLKQGASIYWIRWSDTPETKEYTSHKKDIDKKKGEIKRLTKKNEELTPRLTEMKGRGKNRRLRYTEKKRQEYTDTIAANKKTIGIREGEIKEMENQSVNMHKYLPENVKRPDISNIVSPTSESTGSFAVGNWEIKEGKHGDGWTYKVSSDTYGKREVKTIMRVRPNEPLCTDDSCLEYSSEKNPKVVKQWLKWSHEATIYYADDSKTLTFDTGTSFDGEKVKGMGLRKRKTNELVGNKLVWVGWAPEQTNQALVSPYLLESVVK